MIHSISNLAKIVTLLLISFILSSCDSSNSQVSALKIDQVEKHQSGWPRTIMTSQGLLTLHKAPTRIVSTSVTITGTLLAINAPLIGSGATMPNTLIASSEGFMRQWSSVAKQRGIVPLYQTEPNAESIIQANPDLIIISAAGGDSAMRLYDQLKEVAPILVIHYDDKSWVQLATIFGDLFALEKQAKTVIEEFEKKIAQTKKSIILPPQPTTAMVYYQDSTNIWTSKSAQGRILQQLGFTLATVPNAVKGDISMGIRDDIVIATGERLPDAITGNSILLFASERKVEKNVLANNYLKTLAPINNRHVYAVGNDTFRIDYYSGTNLLTRLQTLFGQKNNGKNGK